MAWAKISRGSIYIIAVVIGLLIDLVLMVISFTLRASNTKPRSLFLTGAVITNCIIPVFFFLLNRAYRIRVKESAKSSLESDPYDSVDPEFLKNLTCLPAKFSFKKLEVATENFSRKLGKGGFGSVYEGILSDGSKVAVKRLEKAEGRGQKEFYAEVDIISRIRHGNLVSLKGFCAENSERLLVYELMANGSLDRWIFRDAPFVMPLDRRFAIVTETARGLAYLHEECEERILHLDVKPQNILLDDNFHVKVSDFGLSRTMGRDESRIATTMRGTPGYFAPEWISLAGISNKTDVFSYGVVLLELISGRKSLDQSCLDPDDWYLPAMAFRKLQEDCVLDLVDPNLGLKHENDKIVAVKMISVALWCIQEDPAVRPMMSVVVRMLEGSVGVPRPPVTKSDVSLSMKSTPDDFDDIEDMTLTLVR